MMEVEERYWSRSIIYTMYIYRDYTKISVFILNNKFSVDVAAVLFVDHQLCVCTKPSPAYGVWALFTLEAYGV